MIQRGSSRLGCVVPVRSFWWFSWSNFEAFLFGIWWGMYAWTLCGSFRFDSPPKSLSKGSRFWGFRCSRVRGVLGGISSIPLDSTSFGGPQLGYGVPMRCSYYPQSLVRIRGANRKIESWIWRNWLACSVHPKLPRLHRSDWCFWPVWPVWAICGICLGWVAESVCLWVMLVLFWLALCRVLVLWGCVLRVFLFRCREKSLRRSRTFVVRLL
jgi:hypothetical protein